MADAACRIEQLGDEGWRVHFEQPTWAPTPGQYLVLYDGDECMGGGVINGSATSDESSRVSPGTDTENALV